MAAVALYAIGFPSEFRTKLTSRADHRINPGKQMLAIFVPAAYFFVVLLLAISYNDVIASLRFTGSADGALNQVDSWMLLGRTVPSLTHGIPLSVSKGMETIYLLMYSQIGACLILLALRCGRLVSMRFISAIATAYWIALIMFYFVPATGPYYVSALNRDGNYISLGQVAIQALDALRNHQHPEVMGTDYFIAFPSLHLTQPLIALWFIRRWRRVKIALTAYCLVLCPSIVLLEQHYVIDLIGGAAVAVVAIAMVDGWRVWAGALASRPGFEPETP